MTKKFPTFLALLGATLVLAGPLAISADLSRHPNLRAAHQALENASRELARANDKKKSEFGGHRAKAESLIREAQAEIEAAADWANNPANK